MNAFVDGDDLRVTWGPFFRSLVPLSAIASVQVVDPPWWGGIGVHLVGRRAWLVNTRRGPAVELRFAQRVPARLLGFPLRLDRLLVGSREPEALAARLR